MKRRSRNGKRKFWLLLLMTPRGPKSWSGELSRKTCSLSTAARKQKSAEHFSIMRHTPTDNGPGTARTPRFATDSFDCELPPNARAEMLKARRPHKRPPAAPRRVLIFLAWFGAPVLLIALLCAVLSVSGWQPASRGASKTQRIARAALDRINIPAVSAPTPAVSGPVEQVVEQPILPPRARLIKLPPPTPRAALVRLPAPPANISAITPEHLDESHDITMPYGTVVHATLRGFLDQENQLPRVGHIGDMYVVGTVPWIFIQVPGTAAPCWVDP
jgi:hypothetical protein